MVLSGTHIAIPQSLRQQVLAIAHEGHVGIVVTKLRLRTKVFMVARYRHNTEHYVRSCHECQRVGQATSPEPLMPTEQLLDKWQAYLLLSWDRWQQGSTCFFSLTIILGAMK